MGYASEQRGYFVMEDGAIILQRHFWSAGYEKGYV